jgi:heme-binding NEAT domain protein
MPKDFRKGDRVEWDTSQGATQGRVIREQTSPTQIKGHNVKASKENPQYVVESDKSESALPTSRVNSEERDSSPAAS